jgi:hypothetical protein
MERHAKGYMEIRHIKKGLILCVTKLIEESLQGFGELRMPGS